MAELTQWDQKCEKTNQEDFTDKSINLKINAKMLEIFFFFYKPDTFVRRQHMNVGHILLKLNLNLQAGLWIRIFMDMHSFSLPDPDPPSKCGYGWEIFLNKKRKNARKLVIIAILFKCFKFAQGQLFCYFSFEKSFMFFQLQKNHKIFFEKFLSWICIRIRIRNEKNCWIRILKKTMRIHSPSSRRSPIMRIQARKIWPSLLTPPLLTWQELEAGRIGSLLCLNEHGPETCGTSNFFITNTLLDS